MSSRLASFFFTTLFALKQTFTFHLAEFNYTPRVHRDNVKRKMEGKSERTGLRKSFQFEKSQTLFESRRVKVHAKKLTREYYHAALHIFLLA